MAVNTSSSAGASASPSLRALPGLASGSTTLSNPLLIVSRTARPPLWFRLLMASKTFRDSWLWSSWMQTGRDVVGIVRDARQKGKRAGQPPLLVKGESVAAGPCRRRIDLTFRGRLRNRVQSVQQGNVFCTGHRRRFVWNGRHRVFMRVREGTFVKEANLAIKRKQEKASTVLNGSDKMLRTFSLVFLDNRGDSASHPLSCMYEGAKRVVETNCTFDDSAGSVPRHPKTNEQIKIAFSFLMLQSSLVSVQ